MKLETILTMFNYFSRRTALVLFDGIGYRYRTGNFISVRYETEASVIRELAKREFYMN